MYEPITPSISYGGKTGIGLGFDIPTFEDLLSFNIKSINREIISYRRNKERNYQRYQLMQNIGIGMEIVKHAIYLNALNKVIAYEKETKAAIKKLALKVNQLILELGQTDHDFYSDSNTERASVSKEALEYIIKMKW